jgi:hypothetical protein
MSEVTSRAFLPSDDLAQFEQVSDSELLYMSVSALLWGGGQGRNRTADASLFRAALYRLSYLALLRKSSLTNRFFGPVFQSTFLHNTWQWRAVSAGDVIRLRSPWSRMMQTSSALFSTNANADQCRKARAN